MDWCGHRLFLGFPAGGLPSGLFFASDDFGMAPRREEARTLVIHQHRLAIDLDQAARDRKGPYFLGGRRGGAIPRIEPPSLVRAGGEAGKDGGSQENWETHAHFLSGLKFGLEFFMNPNFKKGLAGYAYFLRNLVDALHQVGG